MPAQSFEQSVSSSHLNMIALKVFLLFGLLTPLEAAAVQKSFTQPPYGKAEVLFQVNNNGTLTVNNETLTYLFLHPEVKDRKIAVVSINGAYREGKSFFINYCLRFMYANVSSDF